MPRNRVNGDAIERDGAVIRDVNIDVRECNRSGVYRKTQRAVHRDSCDEFEREDDRRSASEGRERGDSRGIVYREDDVELVEGSDVYSISRRLRRDGDSIRLRLLL